MQNNPGLAWLQENNLSSLVSPQPGSNTPPVVMPATQLILADMPMASPTPELAYPKADSEGDGGMDLGALMSMFNKGAGGTQGQGILERGNIDTTTGGVQTDQSLPYSVALQRGDKTVLVPSFDASGRILSADEVTKQYDDSGKHFGVFKTRDDANAYGLKLQEDQKKLQSDKSAVVEERMKKYSHVSSMLGLAGGKTKLVPVDYNPFVTSSARGKGTTVKGSLNSTSGLENVWP